MWLSMEAWTLVALGGIEERVEVDMVVEAVDAGEAVVDGGDDQGRCRDFMSFFIG